MSPTLTKKYYLKPTPLIPNSPYPLLHYPHYFPDSVCSPSNINTHFAKNKWEVQWIYCYGPTQPSHYHSCTHEAMVVLCGTATIRFGVADTWPNPQLPSTNCHCEDGGIEIPAQKGDVFIIPAGVSHKTFDPVPSTSTFALLSPGDGHGIPEGEEWKLEDLGVNLSGFCMMGAYPRGSEWDFKEGGGDEGGYEGVWGVEVPELDPVMGGSEEGVCGVWKRGELAKL
ncbi:hypothetical protein EJ08DRAFT_640206 [Tothia fuscella]|uniref:Cupin type-1 domain-containing protein n=1 Tax=Tothia fuscella TaxID=1048955 RepID=A0A9P4NJ10_9PEZI|nr:hypothetical protein EJ08DRAFT_640206 [Tothia fuscella]